MSKCHKDSTTRMHPVELVCFDIEMRHGVLTAAVGIQDAIEVVDWLLSKGFVDEDYKTTLLSGLAGR